MDEVVLARKAELLKTMAHAGRLRLLLALARGEGCDVTSLICQCGQPQPYVSQQLRVLREAGLVVGERRGLRICYRLADSEVIGVLAAVGLLEAADAHREAPPGGCGLLLSAEAPASRQLLAI
ncbi:MAG: metalloregulator ArsR/SmtB family transcription factor [Anaerolineae bacterium]